MRRLPQYCEMEACPVRPHSSDKLPARGRSQQREVWRLSQIIQASGWQVGVVLQADTERVLRMPRRSQRVKRSTVTYRCMTMSNGTRSVTRRCRCLRVNLTPMLRISTKVRIADQVEEPTFGPCTRRDFGRRCACTSNSNFRDFSRHSTTIYSSWASNCIKLVKRLSPRQSSSSLNCPLRSDSSY